MTSSNLGHFYSRFHLNGEHYEFCCLLPQTGYLTIKFDVNYITNSEKESALQVWNPTVKVCARMNYKNEYNVQSSRPLIKSYNLNLENVMQLHADSEVSLYIWIISYVYI